MMHLFVVPKQVRKPDVGDLLSELRTSAAALGNAARQCVPNSSLEQWIANQKLMVEGIIECIEDGTFASEVLK